MPASQRRAQDALAALARARDEHHEAFAASQAAHGRRHRALIAARLAGASWEEIAAANGDRMPNVTRTGAYALWRSGNYGPVPDEALNRHELRKRQRGEEVP